MELQDIIFTLNLIILSLDHLVCGILGLFFPQTAIKFYRTIFGATIPPDPAIIIMIKPWSALALFAAIVAIFPILDPVRYEGVLITMVALLTFRLYIRATNLRTASQALALSPKRNLFHICLITLCGSIIIYQIIFT